MTFLQRLKARFSPEPNRTKYPHPQYPAWEFVGTDTGKIIARVYTKPVVEQEFLTMPSAQKWVHSVMRGVK